MNWLVFSVLCCRFARVVFVKVVYCVLLLLLAVSAVSWLLCRMYSQPFCCLVIAVSLCRADLVSSVVVRLLLFVGQSLFSVHCYCTCCVS